MSCCFVDQNIEMRKVEDTLKSKDLEMHVDASWAYDVKTGGISPGRRDAHHHLTFASASLDSQAQDIGRYEKRKQIKSYIKILKT